MKECLTGLVALSQSNCECYNLELTPELKTSSFGLYIDDLEGIDMELIKNAIGCGDTLLTNFNKIYASSVIHFESDLQVAISESFRQRFKPYNGRIGEKKYDRPLATQPLVGLKLDTENVDGASIVIKSLDLYFNAAGTINLQVYKNEEHLTNLDIAIDVVEGKTFFEFPNPIKLPIVESGVRNDYYFVYAPGALLPMNNKLSCGCAGIETIRNKFLKPYGVKGTSFETLTTDPNYAYGISLNALISCNVDNMLCDFTLEDMFHRRVAMAIWYKLGVLTIEKLFSSRDINFDTFSDREYLYTRKKKFESNYKNIILWLSENTNIQNSDCFICNSQNRMTMGKILI